MSVLSTAGASWECNLASSLSETLDVCFHEIATKVGSTVELKITVTPQESEHLHHKGERHSYLRSFIGIRMRRAVI